MLRRIEGNQTASLAAAQREAVHAGIDRVDDDNSIGKERAKWLVDLLARDPREFERILREFEDDDDADNMASSFVFGLINGLGEEDAQAVIQAIPSDVKQRLIDFMLTGDVYDDERSAALILQQNMAENLAPIPETIQDQSDWSLEQAQASADAVKDDDWPQSKAWAKEWLRLYHDDPLAFVNRMRMLGYNEDYDRAATYFVYGLYDALGEEKAREVLDRLPGDVKEILKARLLQDDVYARERSAADFLSGAPMAVSSQDDSDEQDANGLWGWVGDLAGSVWNGIEATGNAVAGVALTVWESEVIQSGLGFLSSLFSSNAVRNGAASDGNTLVIEEDGSEEERAQQEAVDRIITGNGSTILRPGDTVTVMPTEGELQGQIKQGVTEVIVNGYEIADTVQDGFAVVNGDLSRVPDVVDGVMDLPENIEGVIEGVEKIEDAVRGGTPQEIVIQQEISVPPPLNLGIPGLSDVQQNVSR